MLLRCADFYRQTTCSVVQIIHLRLDFQTDNDRITLFFSLLFALLLKRTHVDSFQITNSSQVQTLFATATALFLCKRMEKTHRVHGGISLLNNTN